MTEKSNATDVDETIVMIFGFPLKTKKQQMIKQFQSDFCFGLKIYLTFIILLMVLMSAIIDVAISETYDRKMRKKIIQMRKNHAGKRIYKINYIYLYLFLV